MDSVHVRAATSHQNGVVQRIGKLGAVSRATGQKKNDRPGDIVFMWFSGATTQHIGFCESVKSGAP